MDHSTRSRGEEGGEQEAGAQAGAGQPRVSGKGAEEGNWAPGVEDSGASWAQAWEGCHRRTHSLDLYHLFHLRTERRPGSLARAQLLVCAWRMKFLFSPPAEVRPRTSVSPHPPQVSCSALLLGAGGGPQ